MTAAPTKPPLRVVLCAPRGFCAGVVRAIDVVERALEIYGAPVYVRHEIVHNRTVVDALKAKGVIFIEDLSEAPPGPASGHPLRPWRRQGRCWRTRKRATFSLSTPPARW